MMHTVQEVMAKASEAGKPVSESTIYRHIQNKIIRAPKKGSQYLISPTELERWLEIWLASDEEDETEMADFLFVEFEEGQPVEVLRVGEFVDKNGREVEISDDDLEAFVANFDAEAAGQDVPVDVNHEKGEAAGWVSELKRVGDRLMAVIDWNDLGQKLVGDKVYRYVSAFIDTDRKVIKSISLVNFPAVKGLKPVELSEGVYALEADAGLIKAIERAVGGVLQNFNQNGDDADAELQEESLDKQAEKVRRAFDEVYNQPMVSPFAHAHVVEVFDDHVICRKEDGKLFSIPYEVDEAGEVKFSPPDGWTEVQQAYVPAEEEEPTTAEFVIRRRGDEWCLYTKDGDRLIACHDTRDGAVRQERAIQARRHAGEDLEAIVAGEAELQRRRGNIQNIIKDWRQWAGSHTRCVRELRGQRGISNPEALCAWLHKRAEGKWPAEGSELQDERAVKVVSFPNSDPTDEEIEALISIVQELLEEQSEMSEKAAVEMTEEQKAEMREQIRAELAAEMEAEREQLAEMRDEVRDEVEAELREQMKAEAELRERVDKLCNGSGVALSAKPDEVMAVLREPTASGVLQLLESKVVDFGNLGSGNDGELELKTQSAAEQYETAVAEAMEKLNLAYDKAMVHVEKTRPDLANAFLSEMRQ